jgi:DNA (cytosine-5)-methyltransferase 1
MKHRLLYIDLFCGAGGTSSGVEKAFANGEKCAEVIACVNHDPNAIASHAANHPHTLHFTEDIRTLELSPLISHLEKKKRESPGALVVLWASLECTNFSRAKGGQPRDADSRTLAEHLFRYIEALDPDYILIENVEEFMCWGELDENGKPVSKDKGSSYIRWVRHVCRYGYDFDWRILNAADYGAYTSRKRFFGQFARKGLPIAFPGPTHAKEVEENSLFHVYEKWKPVKDVLDLDDEGSSIFEKKKPLCERTLERIYAGLVKFVAGGKKQHEAWILKYNSMNRQGNYSPPSLDEPCPVVATQNRLGMVKCNFLSKQFSGRPEDKNISIDRPAGSITTVDHHAFITAYYGGADHNYDIKKPSATVTTKDRLSIVNPKFLSAFYGNGHNSSVEKPSPTVTTKDRLAMVQPKFILNYRFNNKGSSIEEPAPTICTVGQIGIADCQFLANEYSGGGQISDIKNPSPAVLTTPKQKLVSVNQFLANPWSFRSDGGSIDKPCFTLIARMDKMPPYLISTERGIGIAVYESDSPMTKKVKEFMAMYGIVDIKMRMLKIAELKRIMGFPEDYTLIGTQAEQKKFIGNAVEVNMSRVLCEALYMKLQKVA